MFSCTNLFLNVKLPVGWLNASRHGTKQSSLSSSHNSMQILGYLFIRILFHNLFGLTMPTLLEVAELLASIHHLQDGQCLCVESKNGRFAVTFGNKQSNCNNTTADEKTSMKDTKGVSSKSATKVAAKATTSKPTPAKTTSKQAPAKNASKPPSKPLLRSAAKQAKHSTSKIGNLYDLSDSSDSDSTLSSFEVSKPPSKQLLKSTGKKGKTHATGKKDNPLELDSSDSDDTAPYVDDFFSQQMSTAADLRSH